MFATRRDLADMKKINSVIQKHSKVPVLISADMENGTNFIKDTGLEFPAQMGLAASGIKNAAYQMGLMWNITVALIFIALRFVIPTLFTTNADVIRITASMLIFIALFQVSDCLQAISISILRGLQDVKVIIPIVFVSYVVINIPAGYLMAFRFGLEANGLIIGFIVGLSSCALMTIARVQRNIKQLESKIGN